MTFIKSMLAGWYYFQAQTHWAKFNRPDAYAHICRACSFETNEKYLPRHLVFKGEIEVVLGYRDEARVSFRDAQAIMETHSAFWYQDSNADVVRQLNDALNGLSQ